jgi:hypothetical protein
MSCEEIDLNELPFAKRFKVGSICDSASLPFRFRPFSCVFDTERCELKFNAEEKLDSLIETLRDNLTSVQSCFFFARLFRSVQDWDNYLICCEKIFEDFHPVNVGIDNYILPLHPDYDNRIPRGTYSEFLNASIVHALVEDDRSGRGFAGCIRILEHQFKNPDLSAKSLDFFHRYLKSSGKRFTISHTSRLKTPACRSFLIYSASMPERTSSRAFLYDAVLRIFRQTHLIGWRLLFLNYWISLPVVSDRDVYLESANNFVRLCDLFIDDNIRFICDPTLFRSLSDPSDFASDVIPSLQIVATGQRRSLLLERLQASGFDILMNLDTVIVARKGVVFCLDFIAQIPFSIYRDASNQDLFGLSVPVIPSSRSSLSGFSDNRNWFYSKLNCSDKVVASRFFRRGQYTQKLSTIDDLCNKLIYVNSPSKAIFSIACSLSLCCGAKFSIFHLLSFLKISNFQSLSNMLMEHVDCQEFCLSSANAYFNSFKFGLRGGVLSESEVSLYPWNIFNWEPFSADYYASKNILTRDQAFSILCDHPIVICDNFILDGLKTLCALVSATSASSLKEFPVVYVEGSPQVPIEPSCPTMCNHSNDTECIYLSDVYARIWNSDGKVSQYAIRLRSLPHYKLARSIFLKGMYDERMAVDSGYIQYIVHERNSFGKDLRRSWIGTAKHFLYLFENIQTLKYPLSIKKFAYQCYYVLDGLHRACCAQVLCDFRDSSNQIFANVATGADHWPVVEGVRDFDEILTSEFLQSLGG